MTHKERLEQLVTQYKDVAQKASDATLLKTKLEGAIELTQAIIVEEEDWNFEPVDLYSPPKLDFTKKVINNSDSELDMKIVARQYEKFLENLL